MTRKIVVVSAGLGQPSSTRLLADLLSGAVSRGVEAAGEDVKLDVVELRDHAHEITDNLLTGFPSGRLSGVVDAVAQADALIVVTPIFSASYSGLFKLFFDVLEEDALAGKPVLIAATAGTARHSLSLEFALRPLFAHLRAVVLPTAVFAASEDWGIAGSGTSAGLQERVARAAGELAALLTGAAAGPPLVDRFENVTPFEQLLAGRLHAQ